MVVAIRCVLFVTILACSGCNLIFVRTPIDPVSRSECFRSSSMTVMAAPNPGMGHHFQRVIIVVLENQNFDDVANDPNFYKLSLEGVVLTNYHGLFHPSYSNYLAMVAGTEIRTLSDAQIDIDRPTIACLLNAKGYSWKGYAEGYPEIADPIMPAAKCFTDSGFELYARKHVPFLSFDSIQRNECSNIVPGSHFIQDVQLGAIANYVFYTPNLQNDGHNPQDDPKTGLANASKWLADAFLKPLLQSASFMAGTLIVVTFDESRETDSNNHIFTLLLGPMVRPNVQLSDSYNHYNLLRTIEDNFDLGTLADGDGGATRFSDKVWK